VGSNPAQAMDFKGDKKRSTSSFGGGGGVRPESRSHKILRHVKESRSMKTSRQVYPALLLYVSSGNCHRALVDES
jgi:hypothetical protein